MFNNPYFQGFREPNQQQPIQNIINTQIPQNDLFMARFLRNGEQAENQFINGKTAFIDLTNKQLKIRDLTGEMVTYGLILPLDEKDVKIQSLENEIRELKEMMKHESNANISTTNVSTQQGENDTKSDKPESTT